MTIRAYRGITPRVPASAYVDETALVIGDVELGEDASIWPMAVARGDVQAIRIGPGTNIQDGSVLHVTHDSEYAPGGTPLTIGRYVTVGHRAILHACRVGDRCLIGMGAVVLDGAELGAGLMLGAGALVPQGRRLDGGWLYVGAPAKKLRALEPQEREYLEYSARHYVRLKDWHASQA